MFASKKKLKYSLESYKNPKGWVSILLYFGVDDLKSLSDIRAEDYMLWKEIRPLPEFHGPIEVYKATAMPMSVNPINGAFTPSYDLFNLPRPMRCYDIVNMDMLPKNDRPHTTMSMLLIDKNKDKNLIPQGGYIHSSTRMPLQGILLKTPVKK